MIPTKEASDLNNNHKRALKDANEIIDILTKSGWIIMSIGNIHSYSKNNTDFSIISFSVERKCNQ